jgi:protein subunit release factor B
VALRAGSLLCGGAEVRRRSLRASLASAFSWRGAGSRLAPPTVRRAEADDNIGIEVIDKKLRVDTYRASGSGGQHFNKTDSAVRITHLPPGTAVAVQQERSHHLSAKAIQMLKARLYELGLRKREAERAETEANKTDIG